ncbi:hypothetical protein ASG52_24475 [Methylobacterium sp. Leaf456]|nr:hypothetical protein ASG52_24475 [Methylobacterium sp. Leaf456]
MQEITYRIGTLNDPSNVGRTASSPYLAKRAAILLDRSQCLALEKTFWEERDRKLKAVLTVIEDAEHFPGEWDLDERPI